MTTGCRYGRASQSFLQEDFDGWSMHACMKGRNGNKNPCSLQRYCSTSSPCICVHSARLIPSDYWRCRSTISQTFAHDNDSPRMRSAQAALMLKHPRAAPTPITDHSPPFPYSPFTQSLPHSFYLPQPLSPYPYPPPPALQNSTLLPPQPDPRSQPP